MSKLALILNIIILVFSVFNLFLFDLLLDDFANWFIWMVFIFSIISVVVNFILNLKSVSDKFELFLSLPTPPSKIVKFIVLPIINFGSIVCLVIGFFIYGFNFDIDFEGILTDLTIKYPALSGVISSISSTIGDTTGAVETIGDINI